MPTLTDKLLEAAECGKLTLRKAHMLLRERGMRLTGVVVEDPHTGERAMVERGAVRWLGHAEFQRLMHPEAKPEG